MAEAVFTGKQVEELAAVHGPVFAALTNAKLAGLTEHFFVGDGPGDGRHGKGEYEHPYDLQRDEHGYWMPS
jgi:hypothetical protein